MSEEKSTSSIKRSGSGTIAVPTPLDVNTVTGQFRAAIKRMDDVKQQKYLKWLEVQTKYFSWEETFDPTYLIKYNRGDVIFTNFGYNVGSEFGGPHYAAVLDNNDKTSQTMMVVPLSSLDEGESEKDLHEMDAFIGVIPDINDKKVFARVAQMRALSKIRIYSPRNVKHDKVELTSDQLDIIDEKIRKHFTAIPEEKK